MIPMQTPASPRRQPQPMLHRRLAGALAGACLIVVAAGCAPEAVTESAAPAQPATEAPSDPEETPEGSVQDADSASAEPPASPETLSIPSIDVYEEVVELELSSDGTLEDPSDWDDVGWFSPGGASPTVFAGHVDSPTGPAVFYRLLELEPGDQVEVTDVDGAVHTYHVDRVEDHPKDDFPTQQVYGPGSGDELRLITCTGEWDAEESRHLDNRVVFASAVD